MFLEWIRLRNFRNYKDERITFYNGVNGIVGANAQGKTNILEAIYLLITGRSFRTNVLADMVRDGEESFFIEAGFYKDGVQQKLAMMSDGKKRHIRHNDTPCTTATNILGILRGVIFVPEDNDIIRGGPAMRRRFLDIHIAQVDAIYVNTLIRYNRAMKQRNTLLKAQKIETIDSWEESMAADAEYIVTRRRQAINILQRYSKEAYSMLSGGIETMSLQYKTPAPPTSLKEYYLACYNENRNKEMLYGCTSIGPHRDDITITIDDRDARHFASEGQQRCCVAALRLAEWYTLRDESHDIPFMAIDDLGISLDEQRRKNFYAILNNLGQVFLTSTEDLNASGAMTLHVDNGSIVQETCCT